MSFHKTNVCNWHPLFSSNKFTPESEPNIEHLLYTRVKEYRLRNEFRSLESEPNIVFLENILYTRVKEYRDKYIFSDSHSFSEIFENINKYVLYPIIEEEFYKGVEDNYYEEMKDEDEEEIVIDEEDEEVVDEEEEGFHEYSMEKKQNRDIWDMDIKAI
jgi:hypothetical protein